MSLSITEELIARQPPEAQAIIRALLAEIEGLERRLNEVEAKANKTPQNSSLPPSSRHPHARPPTGKRKSKRKRGGQPGHKKHERELIPVEKCDEVQTLKPTDCRRCGAKLSGVDRQPLRHQVWELPEIKPHVAEYQRHRLKCSCCGETTCAELPAGVPEGQSGPRLMAFVALLMAYYRQSKRRTSEFLGTILGQPCCPALTVKIQNQVAASLRPLYEEAAAELPTQERLNIDETATKAENGKAWLWTFVARRFTVFAVRPTREATALDDLLGDEFHGVVTCDRAKMYWRLKILQWCWSHLKRDFQAMIDCGNNRAKHLGQRLRHAACELFEHWADYRAAKITRATWLRRMGPVRRKTERWLRFGAENDIPDASGTCRELHGHREWLWTFLRHEGLEPTNNAGERSLRHAVIWRKLSFGTQSAAGSRFMETMLTVIESCRQQGRKVFALIAAAVQARLAHQPPPLLLNRV